MGWWRGEGGGISTQFKNDKHKENIQTKSFLDGTPDWILLGAWNNPIKEPVISSDSGDPTEVGEE